MRPIVAGPICEIHRISNLLYILKPYITKVQSYKKILHISLIPEKNNPESILFSFDVTNLYFNIPHDLGLTAIECWLNKYPDSRNERFSKDFVLKYL